MGLVGKGIREEGEKVGVEGKKRKIERERVNREMNRVSGVIVGKGVLGKGKGV